MSRSVLSPQHHAQMHALRQWARKQGKTPSGISNKERQALAQGQTAASREQPPEGEPGPPAPETSTDESDPQP